MRRLSGVSHIRTMIKRTGVAFPLCLEADSVHRRIDSFPCARMKAVGQFYFNIEEHFVIPKGSSFVPSPISLFTSSLPIRRPNTRSASLKKHGSRVKSHALRRLSMRTKHSSLEAELPGSDYSSRWKFCPESVSTRAFLAANQSNYLSGCVASGIYCLTVAAPSICCMRLWLSGNPTAPRSFQQHRIRLAFAREKQPLESPRPRILDRHERYLAPGFTAASYR